MIISFATVKITRSICDIFMKIPFDGSMINCTQKNSGIAFALCLCNTKAKLAIKQNNGQTIGWRILICKNGALKIGNSS